jgi:hypothetical protein
LKSARSLQSRDFVLDTLLTRYDLIAVQGEEDSFDDETFDLSELICAEFIRRGICSYRLGDRVWSIAREGFIDPPRLVWRPVVPSDDLWSSGSSGPPPVRRKLGPLVFVVLAAALIALACAVVMIARG